MPTAKLTITFERPEVWPSLPPQDELHELKHCDFAMQRWLYENNYRLLLKVGDFESALHLFPDVALALSSLRDTALALLRGKPFGVTFPESQVFLEFLPQNDFVECKVGSFGTHSSEFRVVLEAKETAGEIQKLLEVVFKRAVAAGYISTEEADEFLLWTC